MKNQLTGDYQFVYESFLNKLNLYTKKNKHIMINRNEANYTNFDDNKTNKRIVQAPGGSSSLSLGWGGSNEDYSRNNQKQSMNSKQNYTGQHANDSYGQNYGGNKNNNYAYQAQEAYEEPMHVMGNYDKKSSNGNQIGGENGYNGYNMITNQPNTYQNYPPTSKYQQQQNYEEKSDPASFYKPSSSGYKSTQLQEYDMALEQQKHKIESSRGQRNPQSSSNSVHQQSSNDTKPCVKIHQQRNNDIFGGGQYDYWKQDGHNGKQGNTKKEAQYMYEKNNNQYGSQQNTGNRGGYDQPNSNNGGTDKTSVKVHNPPGGRSNFTFG